MKCEEVESAMIDYLDNSTDPGVRGEIEKHLETCERCLDEYRDSKRILDVISREEAVKPDDSLRINFYHMLHGEIRKAENRQAEKVKETSVAWYNRGNYRIAASIALLICGTFIVLFIHPGGLNTHDAAELKELHAEVNALKKVAMFTMMNEESSSDRIQAVNYAEDLASPDDHVIEVLIGTLNHDKNTNVRMAAAYALAKYAGRPGITDSLVKSLAVQIDPILQVTLINILVERNEKSAIKPIQQIITNQNTLKEVKSVAENAVKTLL